MATTVKVVQIGEVDGKLYVLKSDGVLWAREADGNWEEQMLPKTLATVAQFAEVGVDLYIRLTNGAVWERVSDTKWVKQALP